MCSSRRAGIRRFAWACIVGVFAFTGFVPNAVTANLLDDRDGGFELSDSNGTYPSSGYWQRAWLGTAGAVCISAAAHSGGAGLWEYTGNPEDDWWSAQFQELAASRGDAVTASAWVRSQSTWVPGSRALVRLNFLDAAGRLLTTNSSAAITTPNSGWQQLSVQTPPAPRDTAFMRMHLYLEKPSGATGQSVASFDDCSLEKVTVPTPELYVGPVMLGFGTDLTRLSFEITNAGTATLTWTITNRASWLSVSPTNGTMTTEIRTVALTVDRTGLEPGNYSTTLSITSDGGNREVGVFMETTSAETVPTQPSIVTANGYQLMVQQRLPNGALDAAHPYVIKGAGWAPASVGMTSVYFDRRAAFSEWYRLDIQLLKEMNANTVYLFLDPGTDETTIAAARALLDYCYGNGIMVIMTVDEDGSDNEANIPQVVSAFKNHPAILMWALGNEWNLWRPDRPLFYGRYSTLGAAAAAMQKNAESVKLLDPNHPVASILGEIDYPTPAEVSNIVNQLCTAVDVWGANIYRGPEFYGLFAEWKTMSSKPLFLSEFGTDAFHSTSWWPVVGYEDQAMQAAYLNTLWLDLKQDLSAYDAADVCLGGTVFEWNDEWWKTLTGSPTMHDPDGYETTWNPIAQPDGFSNEEWFGVVNVDRERRQAYYTLQATYGQTFYRPTLRTTRQGENLVLSWPTTVPPFALVSAMSLDPAAAWTPVFPAPVEVDSLLAVTNPLSGSSRFFRLIGAASESSGKATPPH